MLLLIYQDNLRYEQTSDIVLDLVTKVIVRFYIDFTSRLLKQM